MPEREAPPRLVAGLILGAGRASRFGSDKRMALLPNGRTMLETVLMRQASVLSPVLLVIGPDDEQAQALADKHGVCTVVCAKPGGMGDSLACGARALLAMPEVEGVLVGLADMPAVSDATLHALCGALTEHGGAVVPVHDGRLGQPRGLARRYFEALAGLEGDQGARHLLDWTAEALQVQVNDPGVLLDVDTPLDLASLPPELK